MRLRKKLKRMFSPYHIVIILCIIAIGAAIYVYFRPEINQAIEKAKSQIKDESKNNEVKVVKSSNTTGDITEEEARKLAVKQCKELKENGVKEKDLEVIEFEREDELYYYISSKENTVEIKRAGGVITKINSIPVDINN